MWGIKTNERLVLIASGQLTERKASGVYSRCYHAGYGDERRDSKGLAPRRTGTLVGIPAPAQVNVGATERPPSDSRLVAEAMLRDAW